MKNENQQNCQISILWDASPLWGHLVLNAIAQSGLSYNIIHAKDCIENKINAKILIVPGGSGRFKSRLLGDKGMQAIRTFVQNGGLYLGLCGGAGLALSDENGGLSLCPWGRNFFKDRTEHLVSGNILTSMASDDILPNNFWNEEIELPVWWPGRFGEPKEDIKYNELQGEVKVIARYQDIGNDFYLSSIPLKKIPTTAFEDWENLYGINLRPNILNNQPCIITGTYGKGQYILSYSHLETPNSKNANTILLHILKKYLTDDFKNLNMELDEETIFKEIENTSCGSNHNILNGKSYDIQWLMPKNNENFRELEKLYNEFEEFISLAVDLHLLFPRNAWLFGWHNSIPGSQVNALRVSLLRSLHVPATDARLEFLKIHQNEIIRNLKIFIQGATNWFLAKKLSMIISDSQNIPEKILEEQKLTLFGKHMLGGGICGELIELLDKFFFAK